MPQRWMNGLALSAISCGCGDPPVNARVTQAGFCTATGTAEIAASGRPRQSRRSDPCGRRSGAVAGSPVQARRNPAARDARVPPARLRASLGRRVRHAGPRRASGGHRHGGRPGSSAGQKLSGTVRYITQPAGPWRHPRGPASSASARSRACSNSSHPQHGCRSDRKVLLPRHDGRQCL